MDEQIRCKYEYIFSTILKIYQSFFRSDKKLSKDRSSITSSKSFSNRRYAIPTALVAGMQSLLS